MGKKKHAEHVNHERWLVSYADLLTLLFAFFVVLFASSVSDKKKTAKMAVAMQSAFRDGGIFEVHSKVPSLNEGGGSAAGTPSPVEMPLNSFETGSGDGDGAGEKRHAEAARKHLEAAVEPALRKHLVTIRSAEEGTTLSLDSGGFFPSGSAEVRPDEINLLLKIAASLPDGPLRVEGHTDDQPIHTAQFPSNWELSTARAAAIADVLMRGSSLPRADFALAGYAEFHPVADNRTPEGRALNRRVDIVLLRSKPGVPAKIPVAGEAASAAEASTVSGGSAKSPRVAKGAEPAAR